MLVKCEDYVNLRTLIWRTVEDAKGFKIKNYLTRTQKIRKNFYFIKVFDNVNLICSFYVDISKDTYEFSKVKSGDREDTQVKLIKGFLEEILKLTKIER